MSKPEKSNLRRSKDRQQSNIGRGSNRRWMKVQWQVNAERTLRLLEANLQTFREHERALELDPQGPALPARLMAAE